MAEQMMPKFPIYIASKGRADNCKTLVGLELDKMFYRVFVEPQDEQRYFRFVNDWKGVGLVHSIRENDRGLAFVRQYIQDFAHERGDEWYWMLDDNIVALYEINDENTLSNAVHWGGLGHVEQQFEKAVGLGQVSLEHTKYVWRLKGKIIYNSYAGACVCNNVEACRTVRFDPQFQIKADRDFTLQLLSSGFHSARFSRYSVTEKQEKTGGLASVRKIPGAEEADVDRMIQKWGDIIVTKTKKRDGSLDARIDWRLFAVKK